jgi:flagellar biosynthesis/type III secretory pathway protein FliH
MPFEETLRRSLETLAGQLTSAAEAERVEAVAIARKAAEKDAAALAISVAVAEERGREAGRQQGLEAGWREGHAAGLAEGREQGVEQGRAEGHEHGIEQGRAEGRERGLEQGRAEGHENGIEQGRAEGRERGLEQGRGEGHEHGVEQGRAEGRQQGLEQGRVEGRAQGLEQGRVEGREQGLTEGREHGRAQGREQGFEQGRLEGREQGLEQGLEQGRAEGRAQGLEQGRAEGHARGFAEGRAEQQALPALPTGDLAAGQRLADAVRAIDRARSLSEILDTLASCAGREVTRVAVLLVQGPQLRGWRFLGFGPAFDTASGFEIAVDDSGIIAEAVRTAAAASADSAAAGSAPAFAQLPPGAESLAVPVTMGGQVVAVLYGDQGTGEQGEPEVRLAWPSSLEVMTRHAARCLESVTAFRAAQMLTARQGTMLGNSPTAEDEQSARRYARLLVSEIKLYHEPDVIAGRRERDLGMRLGGEIARARVLYEQRVPAHVRGPVDHFHDELVRTLADGDGTLLELKG